MGTLNFFSYCLDFFFSFKSILIWIFLRTTIQLTTVTSFCFCYVPQKWRNIKDGGKYHCNLVPSVLSLSREDPGNEVDITERSLTSLVIGKMGKKILATETGILGSALFRHFHWWVYCG